jgi:hypothetical protein
MIINKKGQSGTGAVWGLIGLALVAMVLGVVLGYNALIMEDVKDDFTPHSAGFNISSGTLQNINAISTKSSTVFTISIGVLILGIVLGIVALIAAYRNGMF